MISETFSYKSDAEEKIVEWFHDRAGAKGRSGPVRVRRAFVDITPGGTMFYLYASGGEKCYMAHGGEHRRDNTEVFFGAKPSFWPKGRAHHGWESVK